MAKGPERIIEEYLRKQAKARGLLCWKFTSPGTSGVPDRIIIGQGKVVFVELKAGKQGKLSELQKLCINKINDQKVPALVAWSKEDCDDILDTYFPTGGGQDET